MIVRLLLFAILGYLAYTVFTALKRSLQGPQAPPPEKTSRGEEMLKDPECGTYVARGDAISALVGDERRYFCSEQCKQQHLHKHSRGTPS